MRYPAGWLRSQRSTLEQRLGGVRGVRNARANDLTGSLLITYDPFELAERSLLETLDEIVRDLGAAPRHASSEPAARLDIGRNSLLTLLGTTAVLGLTVFSLPRPLLAGLVVAGGLPTFGRATRTL